MKKALSIFIVCFFAISCFAQEHLSFKGIPITGSMTEFCRKLSEKGFTKISTENNIISFKGVFTGRKATVGVGATADGKNVRAVVVFFEETENWKTLVNTYEYYKDIYTRKYGIPLASKEYNPSQENDNFSLMYELIQDKVIYQSVWYVNGGTIDINIDKYGRLSGVVIIRYMDIQNVETEIKQNIDDI